MLAATASCAPSGLDPRAAWTNPGAGETDPRRKALAWAILAPNPHNMQPWLVDLRTPGEIALYVDRTRLLPVTDPFGRQIMIGCGAFMKLLFLALAADNHAFDFFPFPEGEPGSTLDDRPLFRIRLVPTIAAEKDPLFGQAGRRRTNRGAFDDRAVTPEDLAALGLEVNYGAERVLFATVERGRVSRLKAVVYRGAEIEAHTPAAHRESVERTFIGAAAVAENPWGISLDTPAINALHAVGVMTKAKLATPGTFAFAESLKFQKTAADTARGFVWIVTRANTREDQLGAGAAYLMADLAATQRGLALQPWSQGLQEYPAQKPLFDALHRELAPDGGRIQMLARIGHPKAKVPPAPRRGLAANLKGA